MLKSVLKNFAKLTGKHLCRSLFFNKVAGLRERERQRETETETETERKRETEIDRETERERDLKSTAAHINSITMSYINAIK